MFPRNLTLAPARSTLPTLDWGNLLSPLKTKATVEIGDRPQNCGALEYKIRGRTDTSVLFLNTDYPENDAEFREATDRLYGGEPYHRLLQDIVLGIGGYRVLKALGREVGVYHLNESHAGHSPPLRCLETRQRGGDTLKVRLHNPHPIAQGTTSSPSPLSREP